VVRQYNNVCFKIMKIFNKLKKIDNIEDLKINSIYLSEGMGFLIPISSYYLNQKERILDLTKWRNNNSFAYPTVFIATYKSTKSWLKKLLLIDKNKILFFIVDKQEEYIGHIGLNIVDEKEEIIEIDNVSRGLSKSKGIMSIATLDLINWSTSVLNLSDIRLKVLKSNKKAIKFYEKLGFIFLSEIALFKIKNDDGFNLYTEIEIKSSNISNANLSTPSDFFIIMKYEQKNNQVGQNKL